ncbi:MAG TPA: FHA domain-containing protein, partial [Gemmataceae bacterium]|nr:FHA domain-containing protein [Gemmataceae bacterium]
PVTSADFVIGRDPQCQLRPASPAVSKQHCALSARDGKVYLRDCGSTNGTFLNDEQIAGEREVQTGDRLRVGPLEFDLRIETGSPTSKSTPALKPATAPATPTRPAAKPASKEHPAAAALATGPVPEGSTMIMPPGGAANTTVVDAGNTPSEDPDQLAAMLLGLDDGSGPTVEQMSADPTTVMEMPALGAKPGEEKKKDEKKGHGDSASAAAEVLSKYMRRPRT